MKTLVIIDDEQDARVLLRRMVGDCSSDFQVAAEACSVQESIAMLAANPPDAVLLDIQLRDGTGFDLLAHFPQPTFQIIFITAYDDFAVKAFQYNALDYLLKPIDADDLCRVLHKVRQQQPLQHFQQQLDQLRHTIQDKHLQKIVLSTAEGLHIVPFNELIRLESDGTYTTFFTTKERILVTRTIGDYESLTESGPFFRVHQSHIVNLHFVRKVLRKDGDYALLQDGSQVPIARRRKEAFIEMVMK